MTVLNPFWTVYLWKVIQFWNSPLFPPEAVNSKQFAGVSFYLWCSACYEHYPWWVLHGWGLLQVLASRSPHPLTALIGSTSPRCFLSLSPVHSLHNIYYSMWLFTYLLLDFWAIIWKTSDYALIHQCDPVASVVPDAWCDTVKGLMVGYSCKRYPDKQGACGAVRKEFMSLLLKGKWD